MFLSVIVLLLPLNLANYRLILNFKVPTKALKLNESICYVKIFKIKSFNKIIPPNFWNITFLNLDSFFNKQKAKMYDFCFILFLKGLYDIYRKFQHNRIIFEVITII